jgi:hypothetical protein
MHHLTSAWHRLPGAPAESLQALRIEFGENLPFEYTELLGWSNGGEGSLLVQPYALCLDSAEDVLRYWREAAYRHDFPGFLVIGSNGAGEYIAFDTRQPKSWPVVALDMTNIDLCETVTPVAQDFATLLNFIAVPRADA